MKSVKLLIVLLASFVSLSALSAVSATPFVDDFENYQIGDSAASVWETAYSYQDNYSVGGAEVIQDGSQVLEVTRAYLWHNTLNRLLFSKIKVVESGNEFDWYGSRIAFVNPNNYLERYEVRLYPNTNRIQVNYVDRTGRTGIMSEDDLITTSEVISSTDCNIELGKWYYVLVMKNGNNKWQTMVFSWNRPTCHIKWQDDRIDVERPAIGIQSAGRYVTSRFNEIFAI